MHWTSSAWWTWAASAHCGTTNGTEMRGGGRSNKGRERSTEGRAVNCNQSFLTNSQRGNSRSSGKASLNQESLNGWHGLKESRMKLKHKRSKRIQNTDRLFVFVFLFLASVVCLWNWNCTSALFSATFEVFQSCSTVKIETRPSYRLSDELHQMYHTRQALLWSNRSGADRKPKNDSFLLIILWVHAWILLQ